MGRGLWPGLVSGKKGSGPILSNFFGWFFSIFHGQKCKEIFLLHCSIRTEKLHKIKLFFPKKEEFFGLKNMKKSFFIG